MKKVRFGIIGLGNQGSAYVRSVFGANKVENGYITALCDINPVKIGAIKEAVTNKDVAYFTDYKEMPRWL